MLVNPQRRAHSAGASLVTRRQGCHKRETWGEALLFSFFLQGVSSMFGMPMPDQQSAGLDGKAVIAVAEI